MLKSMSLNPDRVQFQQVAANEPLRLMKAINQMAAIKKNIAAPANV
jgi:coenzyme F420-reducing hydrogenase delta subunit